MNGGSGLGMLLACGVLVSRYALEGSPVTVTVGAVTWARTGDAAMDSSAEAA